MESASLSATGINTETLEVVSNEVRIKLEPAQVERLFLTVLQRRLNGDER